jgi:hypothetical protein
MGGAATLIAIAQIALAIGLGTSAYDRYRQIGLAPHGQPGFSDTFIYGLATWIGWFFSPAGFYCGLSFVEGIARILAALVTGEALPHAPLWLAAEGIAAVRAHRDRPRAEDLVVRDGAAICVETAADKHWNELSTIRFEGTLYRVERVEEQAGQRSLRYHLAPITKAHLVRAITDYPAQQRR